MTVELKACPFCGGKAQIMHTKNFDATRWFVTCLVCGVETPRIARNAAEAYRAWDRRTAVEKQIDTPTQTNSSVCELEQIEEMAHSLCYWWDGERCTFGGTRPCNYECNAFVDSKRLYNAGYRKQEWVSVEDRLPQKNTSVLCYFKYEPESPDVICENHYHGGRLWMSEGSKVTHWMPLPEPPKMKGATDEKAET